MYTFAHTHLAKIQKLFREGPSEGGRANINEEIPQSEKEKIIQAVEDALAKNQEHDPKHEALKLAIQSSLDPVLNDPKKVLEMINYAQKLGKSPLIILAISKRFATLIHNPTYFTELSNIEQRLMKDKDATLA